MSTIPEVPDAPAAPPTDLDPNIYRNDAYDSPLTSSGEEDLGQDWFERTNEAMEETQAVTVPAKVKKGVWKGVFSIYKVMYWLGEQFSIMFGFHEASWDPIFEAHEEYKADQATAAAEAQAEDGAELTAMEGGHVTLDADGAGPSSAGQGPIAPSTPSTQA